MKINLTKITFFAIVAAALVAAPGLSRAEDSTNAPATQDAAPKKMSLHGKVAAVDSAAMTFTIGESTMAITSDTKISKLGQPAVFADITVGEHAVCVYKKDDAGKLTATVVKLGEKVKKAAADAPAPAPGQ